MLTRLLLVLLACLLGACSRAPADPSSVDIRFERADADEIGVLTLSSTRWTMVNLSRASGVVTPLRTGETARGDYARMKAHLERAMADVSTTAVAQFTALVEFHSGDGVHIERRLTSDTEVIFDRLLSKVRPLSTLWLEATGIPKMFWYRDVGPIDWAMREVEAPAINPPGAGSTPP
jgi:hypothetical protein